MLLDTLICDFGWKASASGAGFAKRHARGRRHRKRSKGADTIHGLFDQAALIDCACPARSPQHQF